MRIDSQPDSVQGSADCGGSSEQVSLPRLDPSSQQFDPEDADMKSIRNESGILHLPMALLTVIFVVTGLGLWGILHHWKNLAQTQLRLDRCTGETGLGPQVKASDG